MRQSAELQDEALNCPDRAVTEAGWYRHRHPHPHLSETGGQVSKNSWTPNPRRPTRDRWRSIDKNSNRRLACRVAGMEAGDMVFGPPEMASSEKGDLKINGLSPDITRILLLCLKIKKTSKMVASRYLNMMITIGFWGTPMVPDNPKGIIGIFDAAVDHPASRYQNDNRHGSNIKNINFL